MNKTLSQVIKDLEQTQDKLNKEIAGKFWISNIAANGKPIKWETYIRVELVELLECYPYKHFKDIEAMIDKENALMEAVDILHFALSLQIYNRSHKKGYASLVTILKTAKKIAKKNKNGLELIEKAISGENIYVAMTYGFASSLTMWKVEDIFNMYRAKYVLNRFRKRNGYAQGTYIKIWNNREDNEVVLDYIKNNPDLDTRDLELYLTKEYDIVKEVANNSGFIIEEE